MILLAARMWMAGFTAYFDMKIKKHVTQQKQALALIFLTLSLPLRMNRKVTQVVRRGSVLGFF